MAKGLEDTAFYRYPRLLSLNDVGGDPQRFGVSLTAFHYANKARAERWPHTLLSTSTHDSKRGEDQRARLNVLSELGDDWRAWLERWRRLNQYHKSELDSGLAPSPSDELLYYQTLIGTWPAAGINQDTERDQFKERVNAYMIKAVREAKQYSSWLDPDPDYEAALGRFIDATLTTPEQSRFIADLLPVVERVAALGYYNGLSQTLMKLTAPGVPDIYQGCELWNLSLVDPDNRRPVDYRRRRALLSELRQHTANSDNNGDRAALLGELLATLADGRAKLYVTWQTLALRQRSDSLFRDGDYIPLDVTGTKADHVCAYARQHDNKTAIVVAPRLFNGLRDDQASGGVALGESVWRDTTLRLPVSGAYHDCLSGRRHHRSEGSIRLAALLQTFPLALLELDNNG